jgi:hypothetical protein
MIISLNWGVKVKKSWRMKAGRDLVPTGQLLLRIQPTPAFLGLTGTDHARTLEHSQVRGVSVVLAGVKVSMADVGGIVAKDVVSVLRKTDLPLPPWAIHDEQGVLSNIPGQCIAGNTAA